MLKKILGLVILLCLVSFAYAQEESITFTTYYPSPYGVYREMRAQRMAIGDDYIKGGTTASGGYDWDTYDGDPWNSIDYNADLVVQGNVGIGTTSPVATLHINALDNTVRSAVTIRQSNNQAYGFNINLDQDVDGKLYLDRVVNDVAYSVMAIDRDSGNVGIGTTNPGTNKLEVVGGPIKATGGLIIPTTAPSTPVAGQMWLQ